MTQFVANYSIRSMNSHDHMGVGLQGVGRTSSENQLVQGIDQLVGLAHDNCKKQYFIPVQLKNLVTQHRI